MKKLILFSSEVPQLLLNVDWARKDGQFRSSCILFRVKNIVRNLYIVLIRQQHFGGNKDS